MPINKKSKKVIGIIQARANSTRLPGKVLRPFNGAPMLEFLIRGVTRSERMDAVVVATTRRADDDAVAALAEGLGVGVYRGEVDDVLGRYCECMKEWSAGTVVRITGDNPLTDPCIIDATIAAHLESGRDYTCPAGLPLGTFGELVEASALARADGECDDPTYREHVTMHITRNTDRFSVGSLPFDFPPELADEPVTVDTLEEFERVERIAAPRVADPELPIKNLLEMDQ